MSARPQTVRLTPAQHSVLAGLAAERGLSQYAMLARVAETGLRVMLGAEKTAETRAIADEIGTVSERLVELERMLERTLFTTCAAYAYARNSALGTRKPDEAIAADAKAAFERQRSLATENVS